MDDDRLDEILARQERGLEHMREVLDRQERAFERQERAYERHERAALRQERAFMLQVQAFQDAVLVLARIPDHLDDMRDQIRANTQAVLRALDRLDGPETAPG